MVAWKQVKWTGLVLAVVLVCAVAVVRIGFYFLYSDARHSDEIRAYWADLVQRQDAWVDAFRDRIDSLRADPALAPRLLAEFPEQISALRLGRPTLADVFLVRTGHAMATEPEPAETA